MAESGKPLIPPEIYRTISQLVQEGQKPAQVTLEIEPGRISGATVTYRIEAPKTP